jgi:predicted NBD/HSP70 family sugar kinase
MHTDLVAALDIGGTKIAGALVDGDGRIQVRAQRATPAREDGETVMRAVEEVVATRPCGNARAPSASAARDRWTPRQAP